MPVGVDDGLDAVAQVELGEDAGHEGLDGLVADDERRSDLSVGQSVRDEAEDLPFTGCQRSALRVALDIVRDE